MNTDEDLNLIKQRLDRVEDRLDNTSLEIGNPKEIDDYAKLMKVFRLILVNEKERGDRP
jgi:hypothetical protein